MNTGAGRNVKLSSHRTTLKPNNNNIGMKLIIENSRKNSAHKHTLIYIMQKRGGTNEKLTFHCENSIYLAHTIVNCLCVCVVKVDGGDGYLNMQTTETDWVRVVISGIGRRASTLNSVQLLNTINYWSICCCLHVYRSSSKKIRSFELFFFSNTKAIYMGISHFPRTHS